MCLLDRPATGALGKLATRGFHDTVTAMSTDEAMQWVSAVTGRTPRIRPQAVAAPAAPPEAAASPSPASPRQAGERVDTDEHTDTPATAAPAGEHSTVLPTPVQMADRFPVTRYTATTHPCDVPDLPPPADSAEHTAPSIDAPREDRPSADAHHRSAPGRAAATPAPPPQHRLASGNAGGGVGLPATLTSAMFPAGVQPAMTSLVQVCGLDGTGIVAAGIGRRVATVWRRLVELRRVSVEGTTAVWHTGLYDEDGRAVVGVLDADADTWTHRDWQRRGAGEYRPATPDMWWTQISDILFDAAKPVRLAAVSVSDDLWDALGAHALAPYARNLLLRSVITDAVERARGDWRLAAAKYSWQDAPGIVLLLPVSVTDATSVDAALAVRSTGDAYRSVELLTLVDAAADAGAVAWPAASWVHTGHTHPGV